MNLGEDEFTIKCISCNIDLIDVWNKTAQLSRTLRVRCPKCKDLTFFHKISPEIGISACNKICVTDVIDEEDPMIIETDWKT